VQPVATALEQLLQALAGRQRIALSNPGQVSTRSPAGLLAA
jgi:hypothetical protein